MEKYTLVPREFFNGDVQILSQVVGVSPSETIDYVELPDFEAVLLFVPGQDGDKPVIYDLLCRLGGIGDYNKVLFCIKDSVLHLAIGAGRNCFSPIHTRRRISPLRCTSSSRLCTTFRSILR